MASTLPPHQTEQHFLRMAHSFRFHIEDRWKRGSVWRFSPLSFQSGGPQQGSVCFITWQNEVTPSPFFSLSLLRFCTSAVGFSIFSLSLNLMLFCSQLLSVAFSCFPLLSVAFSCFQLLSVASSCFQLLSVGFIVVFLPPDLSSILFSILFFFFVALLSFVYICFSLSLSLFLSLSLSLPSFFLTFSSP